MTALLASFVFVCHLLLLQLGAHAIWAGVVCFVADNPFPCGLAGHAVRLLPVHVWRILVSQVVGSAAAKLLVCHSCKAEAVP